MLELFWFGVVDILEVNLVMVGERNQAIYGMTDFCSNPFNTGFFLTVCF